MDNLELFFDDGGGLIPVDLDSFFDQIPDPSPANVLLDAAAPSPSESAVSWTEEIEKMLKQDNDDGLGGAVAAAVADDVGKEVCEIFPSDLIVDSPSEGGSGSGEIVDRSSSDDKEEEGVGVAVGDAVGDRESDDPLSNKERRQLRNRDAAARSRERKKAYVKELETKSKYLESECSRLGRLLQCVVAENLALRSSLHIGRTYCASVAKQESAVLLLESLLLGSLFWSLGIMCLFCLCLSPQAVPDIAPTENAGKRGRATPAPRGARSEKLQLFISGSFLTSRKCKASRTKIKPDPHCCHPLPWRYTLEQLPSLFCCLVWCIIRRKVSFFWHETTVAKAMRTRLC